MHCNGIVDCSDNSDEIACDQLEFNKYYDIEQVPRMKYGEILSQLMGGGLLHNLHSSTNLYLK